MPEIGFYHCTRTPPDAALPRLLGRTLDLGKRAVVLCGSTERVRALDAALWACSEPDWLPHGWAETGDPDLQPVWLTEGEDAPNGATFLFLVDGRGGAAFDRFERVFDLFAGDDPVAVEAARERWRSVRAAGLAPVYWQQGPKGWEKRG
jgi:DNA polymerase III subunit chi